MCYALIVEYNGTNYAGFQIQRNDPTIQEKLERALGIVLRTPIKISFAGRTDAGVHATGQVISFASKQEKLAVSDPQRLVKSVNALIAPDIAIRAITQVKAKFHPRYSCIAREYEYLIWNHPYRSALWHNRTLWVRQKLDLEALNEQLRSILGTHDFAAFTRYAIRKQDTIRHIYSARLIVETDALGKTSNLVRFQICANGFLRNMIRILLGTLLDWGSKPKSLNLSQILLSCDRRLAGKTISPAGLYLRHAYYLPDEEVPARQSAHCLATWDT